MDEIPFFGQVNSNVSTGAITAPQTQRYRALNNVGQGVEQLSTTAARIHADKLRLEEVEAVQNARSDMHILRKEHELFMQQNPDENTWEPQWEKQIKAFQQKHKQREFIDPSRLAQYQDIHDDATRTSLDLAVKAHAQKQKRVYQNLQNEQAAHIEAGNYEGAIASIEQDGAAAGLTPEQIEGEVEKIKRGRDKQSVEDFMDTASYGELNRGAEEIRDKGTLDGVALSPREKTRVLGAIERKSQQAQNESYSYVKELIDGDIIQNDKHLEDNTDFQDLPPERQNILKKYLNSGEEEYTDEQINEFYLQGSSTVNRIREAYFDENISHEDFEKIHTEAYTDIQNLPDRARRDLLGTSSGLGYFGPQKRQNADLRAEKEALSKTAQGLMLGVSSQLDSHIKDEALKNEDYFGKDQAKRKFNKDEFSLRKAEMMGTIEKRLMEKFKEKGTPLNIDEKDKIIKRVVAEQVVRERKQRPNLPPEVPNIEEVAPREDTVLNGEPRGARHTGNENAKNITTFVKGFEGWNPNAYADGRQRSIGYGTKARKGERKISKAEGEKRLAEELSIHRKRVIDHAQQHGYDLSPAQIDALTSFDYNTGSLHKLTDNGTRDIPTIARKILQYNKANMMDGKGLRELRGLTRRRKAEHNLFLNGYS